MKRRGAFWNRIRAKGEGHFFPWAFEHYHAVLGVHSRELHLTMFLFALYRDSAKPLPRAKSLSSARLSTQSVDKAQNPGCCTGNLLFCRSILQLQSSNTHTLSPHPWSETFFPPLGKKMRLKSVYSQ